MTIVRVGPLVEFIVAPEDPADGRMMWTVAHGYDEALDHATEPDGSFHPEERGELRVQMVGLTNTRRTS